MNVQALLQTMGAAWTDDEYIDSVAMTEREMSFVNCIVEKGKENGRSVFSISCGGACRFCLVLLMRMMKMKIGIKKVPIIDAFIPIFILPSTISVILVPLSASYPVPDGGIYYSNDHNPHRNYGQASVDSQRVPIFLSCSTFPPSFHLIPLEPSNTLYLAYRLKALTDLPTRIWLSYSLCALD